MAKSLYRTTSPEIMEAVRTLNLEEMLCILHDLAYAMTRDRLRDLGPSRAAGHEEEVPVRPGWHSLKALDHAMRSANFEMPGTQTHEDIVALFGEEGAGEYEEMRYVLEQRMLHLASIMEEHDCNLQAAMVIEMLQADKSGGEAPDDLSGFGWD